MPMLLLCIHARALLRLQVWLAALLASGITATSFGHVRLCETTLLAPCMTGTLLGNQHLCGISEASIENKQYLLYLSRCTSAMSHLSML